jgi:hypothetical protein
MTYTRGQVRDLIRQRCDMERTTVQVNAELNNHINDAAAVSHDFLIATYGANYAAASDTVPTVVGVAAYELNPNSSPPIADFYRPISFRLVYDDESWPLEAYSAIDRVTRTAGTSWGVGALPRYMVTQSAAGVYSVEFDPPPDAVTNVVVKYHTTAPVYTSDADVVGIPHPDLLIMEACIRVQDKAKRDNSRFMQERDAIQRRIESWVGTIDTSTPPQTLRIPRTRRFGGRGRRLF